MRFNRPDVRRDNPNFTTGTCSTIISIVHPVSHIGKTDK